MEIEKILQDQMKYLCSIYDKRQILGVFTYGKLNYGFAENENDIQTMVIFLPTFEEMCINPPSLEPDFITYKQKSIRKLDLRLLYNLVETQEHSTMEALFSEYYIINPRYQKAFKKYIYMNKEAIYHCDQKKKIEEAVIRAKECLVKYEESKDLESLFEACRLRIACRMYIDGTSCENCINFKKDYHINYLWQIKHGELSPDLNEIRADLNSFLAEAQGFKPNLACKDLVKRSVKEIMKITLTDMVQEQDFENMLTEMEKQALEIILNNLEDGHEGNISISQLVADSSISRPVFKNVLQKMKDNLIAEIENKGVKGTYVKVIDGNLLSR